MSDLVTADRRATTDEVVAHRVELRALAASHGFGAPRMMDDGTVVVHSDAPGYRTIARFAGDASHLVGAFVQVVADDVPAVLSAATSAL